jgi:hypothetical protein
MERVEEIGADECGWRSSGSAAGLHGAHRRCDFQNHTNKAVMLLKTMEGDFESR